MTKKATKAILIDAQKRRLREVEVSGLHDMYQAMNVQMIEVGAYLENRDTIYVDEEGLYSKGRDWFYLKGWHQPFKGNGLVVGFDPNTGESLDAKTTITELKKRIEFMDSNTVGLLAQWGKWS